MIKMKNKYSFEKQLADKEKNCEIIKNEHLKEQEEILKQVNAHSKVYEKSE